MTISEIKAFFKPHHGRERDKKQKVVGGELLHFYCPYYHCTSGPPYTLKYGYGTRHSRQELPETQIYKIVGSSAGKYRWRGWKDVLPH